MAIAGRIRCPLCLEIQDGKSDLVYHVVAAHPGQPVDVEHLEPLPPELLEYEESVLVMARSLSSTHDVYALFNAVRPLASGSMVLDGIVSQILRFVIGQPSPTCDEMLEQLPAVFDELFRPEHAQRYTAEVHQVADWVNEFLPDKDSALLGVGPSIYHRLYKSDLLDTQSSESEFIERAELRGLLFLLNAIDAERAVAMEQKADEMASILASGGSRSRGFDTEAILRIRASDTMRSLTGIYALNFIGSSANTELAHVAVDFVDAKRSLLTVDQDLEMYGLPEAVGISSWNTILRLYVFGALFDAMAEADEMGLTLSGTRHKPRNGQETEQTTALRGRRYDNEDRGGAHSTPRTHRVRPHLRFIAQDFVLEEDRRKLADKYGLRPERGYTVVEGHRRGLQKASTRRDANGKLVVIYRSGTADRLLEQCLL